MRIYKFILMVIISQFSLISPVFSESNSKIWGFSVKEKSIETGGDVENGHGSVWFKKSVSIWKDRNSSFSTFTLIDYLTDSEPYPWNKTLRGAIGFEFATKPYENLELKFSLNHQRYKTHETGEHNHSTKAYFEYYFNKRWERKQYKGLNKFQMSERVFSSNGRFKTPNLLEGGNNPVLFQKNEYAITFQNDLMQDKITSFIDLQFEWDKNRNNYQNSIKQSIGSKYVRSIAYGELYIGGKVEIDVRPINNTVKVAPELFIGWHKGFSF